MSNNSRLHYLKVEPNQIYTVQLKYPTPTEVKGLNGKQLRWILLDGRALYTPLFLREKLEELQIKPGVKFTVQKAVSGGNVEWKVARFAQPVQQLLDGAVSVDSPVPEPDEEEPTYPPAALERALKTAVTAAHALTMTQWARKNGLAPDCVQQRIRRGVDPRIAVSTPSNRGQVLAKSEVRDAC